MKGNDLGVCSLQGGDDLLVFFGTSGGLDSLADNTLDCTLWRQSARDDRRVKFRLHDQKRSRLIWMSVSLLIRKLCPTTVVDWCQSLVCVGQFEFSMFDGFVR